jgi:hypothetical protein
VDWSIYNALQCELDPEDLKAHYNSYLAAGRISVYNPVSIMSAFGKKRLKIFGSTGLLAMIFCSSTN